MQLLTRTQLRPAAADRKMPFAWFAVLLLGLSAVIGGPIEWMTATPVVVAVALFAGCLGIFSVGSP